MIYLVLTVVLSSLISADFASSVTIVPTQNASVFDTRSNLKLSCNVTAESSDNVVIKWEKNSKPLPDVPELKDRVKETSEGSIHSIIINRPNEGDAGKYSCLAIANGLQMRGEIEASSKVRVKTPDNVNVVEGEKLKITCVVAGTPPPVISWNVLNETYTESSGRVKLLASDERKIPNTILIIEDIQMSDRGIYTCRGYSNATLLEVQHETMVRIKDKYAALWPFLGICAEVFVLCAIILIYEKKRNKTELEESDTDQSPDQKNTPDHGKDSNLRHRQ